MSDDVNVECWCLVGLGNNRMIVKGSVVWGFVFCCVVMFADG